MAGYLIKYTCFDTNDGGQVEYFGRPDCNVPTQETKLTVSEVAKLTGVPATTLRHYDKIGLLCPERTGEDVSNNRKLYSDEDLTRLQEISTLTSYGFSLDEVEEVFENEDFFYEIMSQKLVHLKLAENHLRHSIQFATFVQLFQGDMLQGLACGPLELHHLADIARRSPLVVEVLQDLMDMDEREAQMALDDLFPVLAEYYLLENSAGFAGVEKCVLEFFRWWDSFMAVPSAKVGYLGFWSIFEAHNLVAEYVEKVGRPGDAGFLEMNAFYVAAKRMMLGCDSMISKVASLANSDVVAALEESQKIIGLIANEMLGKIAAECSAKELANLAFEILFAFISILDDEKLMAYLGLEGKINCSADEAEKVARLIEVLFREDYRKAKPS